MSKDVYHQRLNLWRPHLALMAEARGAADMLRGLSDDKVATAANNPDNTKAGCALAQAELQRRGLSANPPPLAAPSFLRESDVDKAVPGGAHGPEHGVKWLASIVFWAAVIFALSEIQPLSNAQNAALAEAHRAGVLSDADYAKRDQSVSATDSTTFASQFVHRADLVPYTRSFLVHERNFHVAIGTAFSALILWVLASMFRSKPARILLLRKFNSVDVDARLRRFVSRYLSRLGHVFVLSDSRYRRPFFRWSTWMFYWLPTFWAPKLVLIPWDFIRGRFNKSSAGGPMRIWNAQDYRRFGERVSERVSCNAQVMATSRRSIMVRTSDDWWQNVILLLMQSADLIVVDLSDLTTGTEWELDRLVEYGLLERTVFIVRKDAEGAFSVVRERMGIWRRHGGFSTVTWRGLKSGAKEAQRAYERMGVSEGDAAPVLFNNNGRAVAEHQLLERMRAALKAGVRAKT